MTRRVQLQLLRVRYRKSIDLVGLAPTQQFIPAKARVGPDDNRHLRPALPDLADDAVQFLDGAVRTVDIGAPQPGA